MSVEIDEYCFEPLSPKNEKEWDNWVKGSPNGHLMARPGFFRYHADRFEDASLFIRRGKKPIAVLPANRVGDAIYSHQGVSFGGLILGPRTRMGDVRDAVEALVEHFRELGVRTFFYRPAPHPYQISPREEDIYWLEQAGAKRVDTKLHSMLRCGAEEAVRAKKWSLVVRRAQAEGVIIRRGEDVDLPPLWEQVLASLARHGQKPVHSLDDMVLLRSRFPEEVCLTIAEASDGEFLGGDIVFRSGRTVTSLYLGQTETGRDLQSGTMVFNHHLSSPENAGYWYDLGQWSDTDSREESASLLHYKENTGGRLIRRHTWQLDIA